MSHVFPVPPVVLFSDAHVAHHPLYLLQLTSVQFSVADPDPGSRIRCHFDPWIRDTVSGLRDPGWVKKIRIRIRDEQPGSYFRELGKNFFGLKYLNFVMRIRDP
jgi:hypothetical protein